MVDMGITAAATAEGADTTEDTADTGFKAKRTNFASNDQPGFDKEDKMQHIMNNLQNLITCRKGVIVLRMQ